MTLPARSEKKFGECDSAMRSTPFSPNRSRLVPLALDYTQLSRPKPNRAHYRARLSRSKPSREPVRKLLNHLCPQRKLLMKLHSKRSKLCAVTSGSRQKNCVNRRKNQTLPLQLKEAVQRNESFQRSAECLTGKYTCPKVRREL